ncbi:MAG: VTT domain-containing protein [Candidatus Lokiarchaeota archaeon]|nr:VTT domain-containing protein [Candidatus Lokiarchaeota archaeon]
MTDSEKSKKTNVFLIIFLAIIVIITILCIIFPSFGAIFNLGNWFNTDALGSVNYWIAIGFVMLICFLGALVPVPIPYMLPVALFSAAWIADDSLITIAWLYIIGLVLFSSLANTIGDILDYYIGRGAEHILSQDDPELQNRWAKIILKRPKVIPFVILIFGVSPLPESLLMVPLGMVKYDVKKTFLWMLIGKILMMLVMVFLGQLLINLGFFDEGPVGWIIGIGSLYLMWIIIVFMIKYKPK